MSIECRIGRPEAVMVMTRAGLDMKGSESENEDGEHVGEVIVTRPEKVETNRRVVVGIIPAKVEVLNVEMLKEQQNSRSNVDFSPVNCRSSEKQIHRSKLLAGRSNSTGHSTSLEENVMGEVQKEQGSRVAVDQNLVGEGISGRSHNSSPEKNHSPIELDEDEGEVGEKQQPTRVMQNSLTDILEGEGSSNDDGPGLGMFEMEGNLVVGNYVDGEDGSEEAIPVSRSWVVDSCLEFYPKIGLTCEGENDKMEALLNDIEDSRKQPVIELGGSFACVSVTRGSRELKRLDCSVNYEKGLLEVKQGKGRGRGRHGGL
jgi:hypothetical protein